MKTRPPSLQHASLTRSGGSMSQMMSLNDYAVLVESENSEMYVQFEGLRYDRDQVIPAHIYDPATPWRRHRPATIAREFVAVCMANRYDSVDEWPPLARSFVGLDN